MVELSTRCQWVSAALKVGLIGTTSPDPSLGMPTVQPYCIVPLLLARSRYRDQVSARRLKHLILRLKRAGWSGLWKGGVCVFRPCRPVPAGALGLKPYQCLRHDIVERHGEIRQRRSSFSEGHNRAHLPVRSLELFLRHGPNFAVQSFRSSNRNLRQPLESGIKFRCAMTAD